MKSYLENEDLTVFIEGRLDTDSSSRIEEEITDLCKENLHTSLTIDASELQYIASSGLRTVLKLAKAEKNFKIINVPSPIYSVFEMTGFNKIMDISKTLRRINIDDCEILGRGGTGAIYRISEDEIIKVNYNASDMESLKTELVKAKEAFLLGVPTAISFDIVDCGEGRHGVIYETIKSKCIGEHMQNNPEKIDEYTARYVAQLNHLHNIRTDNKVFHNAKDNFIKQMQQTSQYLTEEEIAGLNRVLDALPVGQTLVHGDAHPKNIMMQGDDMFWIDMEMMSVGHPIYDIIAISVVAKISSSDERAIQLSGMNVENLKRFERSFIRHYFKTEDEDMIARYSDILGMLRQVRRIFATGLNNPLTEKYRHLTIEEMRKTFFPYIDQVVDSINFIVTGSN